MSKNSLIIVSVIAILFILFLIILINIGTDKKDSELNRQYQIISKDSSFVGVVEYAIEYNNRSPREVLYIDMLDGRKIAAPANSYNEYIDSDNNLRLYHLRHFLEKGDTIYKPANIDSLVIRKLGINHSFYYPSVTMLEIWKQYGGVK